jgi:hypothetical protein
MSTQNYATTQYVLPGAAMLSVGGKTILSFSRHWNTGQWKDGIIAQNGMTSFNWALGSSAGWGNGHNDASGAGISSASFRPGVLLRQRTE